VNASHERPFAEALTVLAEVFEKKLSPQLVALYFEALAHYEWELIEMALGRAVTACRFFPRPVELIEQIEGTPEERLAEAEQAWRQFYAALNEAGTYRSLYCEDTVLAETIRLVFRSWPEASHLPRPESDDGPIYQVHHKEFVAAYQRLRAAMAERQRPYEALT
jgi:hypothetical protein